MVVGTNVEVQIPEMGGIVTKEMLPKGELSDLLFHEGGFNLNLGNMIPFSFNKSLKTFELEKFEVVYEGGVYRAQSRFEKFEDSMNSFMVDVTTNGEVEYIHGYLGGSKYIEMVYGSKAEISKAGLRFNYSLNSLGTCVGQYEALLSRK